MHRKSYGRHPTYGLNKCTVAKDGRASRIEGIASVKTIASASVGTKRRIPSIGRSILDILPRLFRHRIVSTTIVRRLNPGKWPDLGKHRQDCCFSFFFFFACAVKRRQIRLNAAIGLETEKEGKGKEGERRKRQEGCVYKRGKGRMRKKRNRERVRKGAGSGE